MPNFYNKNIEEKNPLRHCPCTIFIFFNRSWCSNQTQTFSILFVKIMKIFWQLGEYHYQTFSLSSTTAPTVFPNICTHFFGINWTQQKICIRSDATKPHLKSPRHLNTPPHTPHTLTDNSTLTQQLDTMCGNLRINPFSSFVRAH
jgi:hypothetical protein